MIPVQSLSLKEDIGDDCEDDKRYAFLNHFELAQLKAMTPIRGQLLLTPVCCNLRCPYQASVMKMLLSTNNNIVYNPFIILFFCGCTGNIFF